MGHLSRVPGSPDVPPVLAALLCVGTIEKHAALPAGTGALGGRAAWWIHAENVMVRHASTSFRTAATRSSVLISGLPALRMVGGGHGLTRVMLLILSLDSAYQVPVRQDIAAPNRDVLALLVALAARPRQLGPVLGGLNR